MASSTRKLDIMNKLITDIKELEDGSFMYDGKSLKEFGKHYVLKKPSSLSTAHVVPTDENSVATAHAIQIATLDNKVEELESNVKALKCELEEVKNSFAMLGVFVKRMSESK